MVRKSTGLRIHDRECGRPPPGKIERIDSSYHMTERDNGEKTYRLSTQEINAGLWTGKDVDLLLNRIQRGLLGLIPDINGGASIGQ